MITQEQMIKIREILIIAMYGEGVEKPSIERAMDIDDFKGRAIDYYLSKNTDKRFTCPRAETQSAFYQRVNTAWACIIEIIKQTDQSISEIEKENGEYFCRLEVLKDECASLNKTLDAVAHHFGVGYMAGGRRIIDEIVKKGR